MCCGGSKGDSSQKASDANSKLVKPGEISLSKADCPDFPANGACEGDLVIQCYNQTGCFSGRQLSSPISFDLGTGLYVQYQVLAISDSNGGYYNVPTQDPVDLKISFYQSNVPDVDWQLCGVGGYNQEDSTILAAGQYIWFCQPQYYYIGCSSGDTASIPTTQFYVCLKYEKAELGTSNYLKINQWGKCQTHACNKAGK
jgi:hypothetical protein